MVAETQERIPGGERISAAAAARWLGVTEAHVRKMCRLNMVPAEQDDMGHWRLDREAIKELVYSPSRRPHRLHIAPTGAQHKPTALSQRAYVEIVLHHGEETYQSYDNPSGRPKTDYETLTANDCALLLALVEGVDDSQPGVNLWRLRRILEGAVFLGGEIDPRAHKDRREAV